MKAGNGRSKYVTYLEINPELQVPQIYLSLRKKKVVSMLAKLRTSSHNLKVEMGRRMGIDRDQRLCHCGQDIEHEKHFLLDCDAYYDIRRKYDITRDLSVAMVLDNEKYVKYIGDLVEERKKYT